MWGMRCLREDPPPTHTHISDEIPQSHLENYHSHQISHHSSLPTFLQIQLSTRRVSEVCAVNTYPPRPPQPARAPTTLPAFLPPQSSAQWGTPGIDISSSPGGFPTSEVSSLRAATPQGLAGLSPAGQRGGWRPREELMLQLESECHLAPEFSLPRGPHSRPRPSLVG